MDNKNTSKRVKELAEILNWDTGRVRRKLNEMGVLTNSELSEVTASQVEDFYKYINFDPDTKKIVRPQAPAAQNSGKNGNGEGVIRRIRREVPETAAQQSTNKNNRTGTVGTADSDLRSGFVTVTGGSKYDNLDLSKAKAAKAKTEAEETRTEEPKQTAADGDASRPRIRRRAGSGSSNSAEPVKEVGKEQEKEPAVPEEKRETRNEEPVKAEETKPEPEKTAETNPVEALFTGEEERSEKAETAEKKEPEKAAEETPEKASAQQPEKTEQEKKAEPEISEKKEDSSEKAQTSAAERTGENRQPGEDRPQRENRQGTNPDLAGRVVRRERNDVRQPENGQRPQNRNGYSQNREGYNQNRDGHSQNREGYNQNREGRPQNGDRPFNRDRNNAAGGTRPQGDRPYNKDGRDFNKDGRDFNKDGGKDRPTGGQRPAQKSGGFRSENQAPLEPQRRDKGADKDTAKKEKRNESSRRQGTAAPAAGNKERYNQAQRLIGDKLGVDEVMSDEFSYTNNYDFDSSSKKTPKQKKKEKEAEMLARQAAQRLTSVQLPPTLTVKEFAESIKKTATEVIKKLMGLGIMATMNQEIDFDTAALIANDFGIEAQQAVVVSDEELLIEDPDDLEEAEDSQERPPVVVVMGHVDHGKTSLLDAIRNTSVTAGEAGGITQHIGAYTVTINGHRITFLDTPGHEAFTAMRARGAQVTDVAIIVVAADDGVMPQTIEAINHAKAANVSIVVAVNKIDKEGVNLNRVMTEMAEQDVICEEFGGDVPFVPVSAKMGTNIDTLLETVILSADILQLKASPTKQCKGTVIEAKLDKNKGPIATLLVQRGTLRSGDAILTETTFGHIRTMTDDKGRTIKAAGPSTPVEVTGLPEVPEAGKVFYVVNKDEKLAKKVCEERIAARRQTSINYGGKVTLEDLFSQIQAGEVKNLDLIVKADVKGSVEAIKASLEKLSNDEVRVRVIHGGVGGVNESDVLLAEASNAVIIGFNVRPVGNVGDMAKEKGVDIKMYRVIYDAIDDVKAAMVGMLKPEFRENVIGHVEIRKTFRISGVGTIAGGYVLNGKVVRNSEARIVRDGIVVYEGHLASLKRFKDDVKEVAAGFECGLSFEKFDDLKEGDVIESYVMEQVERTI